MKNINQKREQFFTLNTFLKATSFLIGAGMIGIVSLGLFGCNDDKSGTKNENLVHAVATTGMIADIVTNVGGEYVDVVGLMGPGVDPHLYRASEGDVRKLSDANIIFYNGLHLEAKMGDIFKKLNKQKPTVAVAERIPKDKLKKPPEFEGQFDPHVWFDVELWAYAVDAVGDTLITLDPENKEAFLRNKAAYLTKLNKLNTWIEEKTDMIPKEQRVLVTAHDAFNYYGLAYGFVVKGLMGISTESEAGTRDIQNLATYIVDNKIPAIFIESSISKRNIEAVQRATQSRGWDVKIGGELFSDAMGNPGTAEGTYIGMVEHNTTTILNGLAPRKKSIEQGHHHHGGDNHTH
jgi:manganese/zinc/iron transport system substrate-binding protein